MDNLLNKISDDDKRKMSYYLSVYGDIKDEEFVGIDKWLEPWSYAKRKMYKALGNNIITSVPICVKKDRDTLRRQVAELLDRNLLMPNWYNSLGKIRTLYKEVIELDEFTKEKKQELLDAAGLTKDDLLVLNDQLLARDTYPYAGDRLFFIDTICSNEFPIPIKMRLSSKKKMLQIQVGCKWMKGVTRLLEYLTDIPIFKECNITRHLGSFRDHHSTVFTGKDIEADLKFSIHPFDFLTMSDNAENWESCMNWRDGGCYKLGTIEMMNSNNVICCYIQTKNDFDFNSEKEGEKDDSLVWNSKSWRCLCYVTKDIILVGKAYPYESKVLSLEVLKIMTAFVKENFGWTYSFGPEPYEDMRWITTGFGLQRARGYLESDNDLGVQGKKNIIFETGVMYNDMLNDSREFHNFLCVRNSVPHTKFIKVSGKCNCIGCGNPLLKLKKGYDPEHSYREDASHNDRFVSSEKPLCEECENNSERCPNCGRRLGRYGHLLKTKLKYPDGHIEEVTYCDKCIKYIVYGKPNQKYPSPARCRLSNEPILDLSQIGNKKNTKPYPRITIVDLRKMKEHNDDNIYEETMSAIESPTYEFPRSLRWKIETLYGSSGILACRECVDEWIREGKIKVLNNKFVGEDTYYVPKDSPLDKDFLRIRDWSPSYEAKDIDENFVIKGVQ